jgi:hypothetical protein
LATETNFPDEFRSLSIRHNSSLGIEEVFGDLWGRVRWKERALNMGIVLIGLFLKLKISKKIESVLL